ncbi:hypothetical protein [Rickettsiella endosymbiont of Dermanyssus gallinae]|uniref:hypothetical protein n=1 Tax=Rickettsiella endosymbiont of Dermanyssus gallinae TaxID=2856608 RepID=UPI001C5277DA|nr:hypothetical protein [Rickettsiella endosymbiont of Dermanyssus gallinae]
MPNLQHLAVGNSLGSGNAESVGQSIWCVTKEYDRLIMKAVAEGYESYNDLPKSLKYNLALEIVKAEKDSIFSYYDQNYRIEKYLFHILLNAGSQDSLNDLSDYLLNSFMSNKHFIGDINDSIEQQINTKKGGMKHA